MMDEEQRRTPTRVVVDLGPWWFLVIVAVCLAVATLKYVSP